MVLSFDSAVSSTDDSYAIATIDYEAARQDLLPNLARNSPAARYSVTAFEFNCKQMKGHAQ